MSEVVSRVPSRGIILTTAYNIINNERQDQYGNPEDNFATIADYWNTYLDKKLCDDGIITAKDVAMMMVLLKIAREQTGSGKEDNYIDAAGYIGLASDFAGE